MVGDWCGWGSRGVLKLARHTCRSHMVGPAGNPVENSRWQFQPVVGDVVFADRMAMLGLSRSVTGRPVNGPWPVDGEVAVVSFGGAGW